MRARKQTTRDEYRSAPPPPREKTPRGPRVRLTHLEVRRGERLRLRIAVADDALAEVGDELGALIKKVAPSTRTAVIPAVEQAAAVVEQADSTAVGAEGFPVNPQHEGDAGAYHADLRAYLTEMFGSLCDASLADALEIVREERARRAEGSN